VLVASRMTSSGEHDHEQRERRGDGTGDVHGESACTHGVGGREQGGRDEARSDPEAGHVREVPERVSPLPPHPLPLVERPVRELGRDEQATGDGGSREVERRVRHDELDCIEGADEQERTGNELRPPCHERNDEHEQGGAAALARPRQRQRGTTRRADDRRGADDYTCVYLA
jgi:hypothetical protein